jgi:hypothetical protein
MKLFRTEDEADRAWLYTQNQTLSSSTYPASMHVDVGALTKTLTCETKL